MKPLHLFEAYGVELEYMIVDRTTLNVKPLTEKLLQSADGSIVNELSRGKISWSNELVSHVLEIKCTQPEADLAGLMESFQANVQQANEILAGYGAQLMPTAMHPWMNPTTETVLWPYGQKDIYQLYDRLFNCQGHGWANLQSTHINLPFHGDEEFAKLHAAIRVLLPLLPALAASSPIVEALPSGVSDSRLFFYEKNQAALPSLAGSVIPEKAYSKSAYERMIYQPIAREIAPHDPTEITEPVWLNSRGAIARFDRGAIEIRLLDLQESPQADMAIVALVSQLLKLLTTGKWIPNKVQETLEIADLYAIYSAAVKYGENGVIKDKNYLRMLGMDQDEATFSACWAYLIDIAKTAADNQFDHWASFFDAYRKKGTLSSRILYHTAGDFSPKRLRETYSLLCNNLHQNQIFQP